MSEPDMTIEDVANYANSEGLGYAIQHGFHSDSIIDEELAALWRQAEDVISKIEEMLPELEEI